MSTPHNSAAPGQIAKTVFMSGDPLRAKMIAENFLDNPVLYNEVRGMYGYTGTHNCKTYSVQGHGMGIPSIGIYSYELFKFYDVDVIVRLGTCGALDPSVKVGTIIIGEDVVTDSNFGYQYDLPKDYVPRATPELVQAAIKSAQNLGYDYMVGTIAASDVFYQNSKQHAIWKEQGVLGVEMESNALYINADVFGKKALTILTVSDNIATGEELDAEHRQLGLKHMIEVAFGM